MSMTRKIKRTMAHKQLSEEGYRRVNFARRWKEAAHRRAELMKVRRS